MSCGMWYYVIGQEFSDVSKDHTAFLSESSSRNSFFLSYLALNTKEIGSSKLYQLLAQRNSVTPKKTWVFGLTEIWVPFNTVRHITCFGFRVDKWTRNIFRIINYKRKPVWSEINMSQRHFLHHKSHIYHRCNRQNLLRKKAETNPLSYVMV